MDSQTNSNASVSRGIEIFTSRVFDAPRDVVFSAFANPAHLVKWWGPNGFTNTIARFEFRPGGAWHIVMHAPNGTNYDNASEFIEVIKPERIVFQHLEPVHRFQMTMIYEDVAPARTRLTWRMMLERSVENEKLKQFLADANEQNFDRLESYIKRLQSR
jgi:uncharacterized protein YndB with AHSA1/START domain